MNAQGLVVRFVGVLLAVLGVMVVAQQEGGVTPMLAGGMVLIGLGAVLILYGDGR